MSSQHILPDWNSLAPLADDELHLFDTAMLIARDEYPQLDARGYHTQLDGYVRALRPRVERDLDPAAERGRAHPPSRSSGCRQPEHRPWSSKLLYLS